MLTCLPSEDTSSSHFQLVHGEVLTDAVPARIKTVDLVTF